METLRQQIKVMNEREKKRKRFENVFWIIFTICLLFSAYGYKHDTKLCKDVMAKPCEYCNENVIYVPTDIKNIEDNQMNYSALLTGLNNDNNKS